MYPSFYHFLLTVLFCTAVAHMGESQGKQPVLTIEPGPGNPRNSEGDFIKLQDGRVIFIYTHYDGESTSDHASAYLASRFSKDGGKSWSQKDQLTLENEGEMNIMSVSLLRLADGRIALFYLRKNSTSDCIPMMRTSDDEAASWSGPQPVISDRPGYYVLNNDRVIQLESGRMLVPVALHKTPDSKWSNGADIYVYHSDDQGKSWQCSRQVPNPEGVVLQEPGVVELADGRLMMLTRTDAGVQYQSYSEDQGESWSAAAPTRIVSPLSPASVERIPGTDDLLLVWNNNLSEDEQTAQLRTPLNTAVSRDGGKSWEHQQVLENDPEGWYCYTAITFVGDDVLLAHCAGKRPAGTGLSVTQISRLSLDWLYER